MINQSFAGDPVEKIPDADQWCDGFIKALPQMPSIEK